MSRVSSIQRALSDHFPGGTWEFPLDPSQPWAQALSSEAARTGRYVPTLRCPGGGSGGYATLEDLLPVGKQIHVEIRLHDDLHFTGKAELDALLGKPGNLPLVWPRHTHEDFLGRPFRSVAFTQGFEAKVYEPEFVVLMAKAREYIRDHAEPQACVNAPSASGGRGGGR